MNSINHQFNFFKYVSFYGALCLFLSVWITPAYCDAQNNKISAARHAETIIIKGDALSSIIGEQFERYSLMAVVSGNLQPIPFQFDDINVKGFPYAPGSSILIDGSEMIMDAKNELVFMYIDSADKLSPKNSSLNEGEIVAEIEISEGRTNDLYT